MAANPELVPVDVMPTAEPIVVMAIPAGAWQSITDLARHPGGEQYHRHLRRALDRVNQVDSVIHAVLLVRDGEVEGVSAHLHQGGAEAALTDWLRQQPELWPGITHDDWHHLCEAGLAPLELLGSTTMMLPVDTIRGTGGRHR